MIFTNKTPRKLPQILCPASLQEHPMGHFSTQWETGKKMGYNPGNVWHLDILAEEDQTLEWKKIKWDG